MFLRAQQRFFPTNPLAPVTRIFIIDCCYIRYGGYLRLDYLFGIGLLNSRGESNGLVGIGLSARMRLSIYLLFALQ